MSNKPPLVGYNTNVRHDGNLFHIQTEDSGVDHPHIITHLFVEGTILATKKCTYQDVLEEDGWEAKVRSMMKGQHKSMFIELRDGVHDEIAAKIFASSMIPPVTDEASQEASVEDTDVDEDELPTNVTPIRPEVEGPGYYHSVAPPANTSGIEAGEAVRVIRPADMHAAKAPSAASAPAEEVPRDIEVTPKSVRQRSIFDTPDDEGEFGENLITDKSLDEVILSYLTDELDE